MDSAAPEGVTTRRKFVGGMAATVLATVATAGRAQTADSVPPGGPSAENGAGVAAEPPDYPKPPFLPQHQEWPGLAGKMHPKPDHGEESYKGSGRLAGRKALITGGDSGMGRAAAIAFAREGADVAINYLPAEEEDAHEVADLIRAAGRKVVTLPGDIREEAFCQQLVTSAANQLGGLDILVNCAGYQQSRDSIADITTEQFDWTFKTNVYALFWITKAAMAHMGKGSAIINTASIEAFEPDENLLDYAPTKASIVAFTKSLAKQVAGKGIRVNAVAPGPIWTPLQVVGGQPQAKLIVFGGSTPMKRPGQPAELAGIYVLLASNEDSYATGQVYGAQGGRGNP